MNDPSSENKLSFVNKKCSFSYCSCRRVSFGYDTTPIYGNENVSNTDQTEMYTGLDFKEDRCAYQALTRGKEVIYSNTNI